MNQNKFKRMIWISIGFISFVLGTIGTILPILPTFPFYLLTAFSFAKSSEKLHEWFMNTNLYKNNFKDYVNKKGMTVQTKIKILTMVSLFMLIGFIAMASKNIVFGCFVLSVVWLFHVIYFIWGIKTLRSKD